ncbi:MAG: helix-turn-helix transcriptional regulator [Holophagales bacterium]|nr:helix-turn-helix transcriptional regulator [Holophagales bacterium]MYH26019.1 helix-turn-helix transcriptional regulator [Holophagales bacterium]
MRDCRSPAGFVSLLADRTSALILLGLLAWLFVQAAIDYIADHPAETVRLEDLARHIRLSPAYLQRLFVTHVGESPAQYARRLRLERAAWLLRRPGATVTEVALESGYGAPEAFTRAFRSRFGVSPSGYRQGLRARMRERT